MNPNSKLFWLAIASGVLFFLMSGDVEKKPPDVPDDPVSAVSLEIRKAFADSPPETAKAYGAFYDQCASLIEIDSKTPVAKLRERMMRAKELLQLKSPVSFGDIVSRELSSFEEGTIDRDEYAKAFRRLSIDCRNADR